MSEYIFGVTRVSTSDEEAECLDRICREEGGNGFVSYSAPGNDVRGWFTGPNLGFPFDRALSTSVLDRVRQDEPALAQKLCYGG